MKPFADEVRPLQAEIIRISRTSGWRDDPVLLQRFNELEQQIKASRDPRYRHIYDRNCTSGKPVTREELQRLDW